MIIRHTIVVYDPGVVVAGVFVPFLVNKWSLTGFSVCKFYENMRFFPDISMFNLLSGIIGDWKNVFTVAQNEQFDTLYEKEMKGYDFSFIYQDSV